MEFGFHYSAYRLNKKTFTCRFMSGRKGTTRFATRPNGWAVFLKIVWGYFDLGGNFMGVYQIFTNLALINLVPVSITMEYIPGDKDRTLDKSIVLLPFWIGTI